MRIEDIVGKKISEFQLIVGGSLIIHIGDILGSGGRFEYRLHIDPAWRLQSSEIILGSLDVSHAESNADKEAQDGLAKLNKYMIGKYIQEAKIKSPVADLHIALDNDTTFSTFAHTSHGEHWELRCADGARLGMDTIGNKLKEWRERPDRKLVPVK